MGNDASTGNRMGISAMALTTPNINATTLTQLTTKMKQVAEASGLTELVTKTELEEALKTVETFDDSDSELFRAAFTMFDNAGENQINFKEFIAGMAGCLLNDSIKEKLVLACKLYDTDATGQLARGDFKKVLYAINNTASYFGDAVLTPEAIDGALVDTFNAVGDACNSTTPLLSARIQDFVDHLAEHRQVENFSTGKGLVRFGR